MFPESPGPQHCVDRRQLLRGALAAALPAIALPASAAAAKPLEVGGLPVTCNLTLPVACVAKAAANRIAIPARFAVDFLFLRKMLAQEGMTPKDIQVVEMAPPDMPAALYAKAVDAYCTGEPFGAAAQRAGYARPLSMTRDEWRKYICCVLTVRQELIKENRPLVQQLVNYVQAAGRWLDSSPENRKRAV